MKATKENATGVYAFLVHPPEITDVAKKFPIAKLIPKSIIEIIIKHLPPLVGSKITGFRLSDGTKVKGWIVICPLTARQMMEDQELAREKVLASVRLAEKLKCTVIGLGAFTSIVTDGGLYLRDKVKIGLTTGNAYAAALALENLSLTLTKTNKQLKNCTIAVVGAAGSVGSACAKILASQVKNIILIDKREEELKSLVKEIGSNNITWFAQLPVPINADAIITATSAAGGIIHAEHLLPGTIVIDCAQPHNVSDQVVKSRDDILVINSGIALIKGLKLNMNVGLRKEEAFACLGEALTLVWRGWNNKNYSLGQVNPEHVREILEYAPKVGLRVANFRNVKGLIPETDFEKIRVLHSSRR
jgi:fatty aldehyde-generating acyl-ACP reductase